MCPSAAGDSLAAEVSVEKYRGYMVMKTLKEPGEDATELDDTCGLHLGLLHDIRGILGKRPVLPSVFA